MPTQHECQFQRHREARQIILRWIDTEVSRTWIWISGRIVPSPRPTKPSSREPLTMRFSIVYTTVVLKGVHFPPPPGQPRCYLSYLDGLRGRVLVGGARAHGTAESARLASVLACKSTYSFIFGEPVADVTRGSDVCGRVLRCEGGPGATATTDSAWPLG